VVAIAFLAGGASGVASTQHGPDLVLNSLSQPPAQLTPGSTFSESFSVMNIGDRRAGASSSAFYLSQLRHVDPGAIRLVGA
jgi:hypothetical protein